MPQSSSNSSPLARTARDYWRQSQRPLTSLLFVMPLLLVYEAGVLLMGPDALRNGADVWLRQLLDWLGFGEYFLLPVLTVCTLLGWHHLTGDKWRVSAQVLYGMLAESLLLAAVLVGVARLQARVFHLASAAAETALAQAGPLMQVASLKGQLGAKWFLGELVRYFGAGIYEEVLFRLLLFSAILGLVRLAGAKPAMQMWVSVAATSLLFSAAHYVGPYGDTLELYSFTFRFLAGAMFAMLFYYRGFGIAAGTHALYDIFVGFA